MSLQVMQCHPDPIALAAWATRQGLLSPDGDYGYALHALLRAAFGKQAPKPFRYLGGRQGLLAYTDSTAETLQESTSLATPDVARALGLESLDTRKFPSAWREGQRLGFEVRIRPVVRTRDGRERDAYLHAVEPTEPDSGPRREAVYADWLTKQLGADGAAQLLNGRMDAFRLCRVIRRAHDGNNGKRKTKSFNGPDALFKGELAVTDGEAFSHLVTRGIGRHRTFGFGMLLLKPANSC
ncbi:type I-E CRISPR-associated protein Cas6/Cse3/CasE [endosymbiont of Riftia pachyptila]|uniref:CRISPR-associated protein, Cse3 family n=1 Tax=endosymbiont of Riftia pachyptila (vent Ph05) TaxID=1048808 RepID=G2DH33_9GAMM|nr:type I-E CRISPR-associated protein Cas6/Cse3/CasE [endosymbiont of Riftia pachyptila]EGV50069.1 CRISPR-associated protein, Cse3 family [endosymbiont of Riftia pachyptila (vent Ph05)]